MEGVPFGAAQFPIGLPQQIDEVPRFFHVHRHGLPDILHLSQDRKQQCRRDRDPNLSDLVVVLHAVLSRDAGDAVEGRDLKEGLIRTDELGELVLPVGIFFGPDRVAPAEIIQPRQSLERRPDRNRVPDRLVDRAGRHVIRVDVAVSGADAVRDDDSFERVEQWPDHRGVAWAVVEDAGHRFDHASPLHFVVILADDRLLAADIESGEHPLERSAQIRRFGKIRFGVRRGTPAGPEIHLREALMQEIHADIGDGLSSVADVEPPGIGVAAENGGLHVHPAGEGEEFFYRFRRHGQGHPLLGFRDENLPWIQSRILQRRPVQIQFAAARDPCRLSHGG